MDARRDDRRRRRPATGSSACPRCSRSRTAPNPTGRWRIRPATSPISTIRIASPRSLPKQRAMTLFGIDRLLAEPELAPPARRQARRAARPPGVGHPRPDPQPRRARRRRRQPHRRLRPAARPARRQAGQYGRDRGLHRPGPRHPGVQPLRRGPPPDRPVDGHVRHHPDRPAGPRLPHLHLHHDAALRARSRGRAWQERCGCSTGPTRPAGRSRG